MLIARAKQKISFFDDTKNHIKKINGTPSIILASNSLITRLFLNGRWEKQSVIIFNLLLNRQL